MGESKWLRLLALALAFVLTAAACGDSDDGDGDVAGDATEEDAGSEAEAESDDDDEAEDDEGGATANQDDALGNVEVGTNDCANPAVRDPGTYNPVGNLNSATSIALNSYSPFDDQTPATFSYYGWLFEGLVRQEVDGSIVPWLATCWEVAEDGAQVTFQLNEGVTFTDGAAFNAEAVKANIDYVMSAGAPAVIPPVANQMASIVESVEVVDDLTVQFNLLGPGEALLLSGLIRNSGLMVSPDALDAAASDPVGTGPYVLDSATADLSEINLVANENYWLPGEVGLETVTLFSGVDTQARYDAYVAGQYDVSVITNSEVATVGTPVTANTNVRIGWVVADWTGEQIPQLANKDVRCAMAQALNRVGIQQAGGDPGSERTQFAVSPDDYGYIEDLDVPEFDLEAAVARFEESGEEGFTFGNGHLPGGFWPEQSSAFATALAEMGITMENEALDPPNAGEMFVRLAEGRYPVQIIPFNEPNALMSLIARTGDSPFNPSGETPEGVLDLIESAKTKSFEEGEADVAAAWKIMLEECVFIINNVLTTSIAYNENVTGVAHTQGIPIHFWPQGVRVDG